ncbi:hypothetical protein AGLY_018168 [Aphis glycines]|uniref:TraD/TraG TraM recognition site domain-containing protein n=1 Tax=Aphis glycines TaxID=307491 RepID=A0A6G0SSY6_APHGL|nr:hypothetical protein AGLY_018168 [Aphis glycines]
MELIEQDVKLNIDNVDTQSIKKPSRHGPLLPDTIRAILVGPSGSDGIKGVNFIIFSKGEQVIKPNLALKNSIFIFDDVILDNQSPIREFFTMGRHSGASSIFYLAQTYSKIPKQLVRDNSNFLIILKQDDKNLHHIFNDHSSADMNFLEFRKISHLCWNHNDYGFLVIDKTREMGKGRYRCENLITSKKNIKRKIMEMKRGVIDSDNYFHETFRPILEPLNILSKKNKSHISHNYPVDQKNIEVQYASDEDDDNLNSSYNNFF